MNTGTTISSIHWRCATRILFRPLGELKPKDQVIPKNVALGRRAKQRGLTHAHHRQGLEVEPKAAGQFYAFSEKKNCYLNTIRIKFGIF